MDETSLKKLQTGTEDEICAILKDFNEKHIQVFTFPDLNKDIKQTLVDALIEKLSGKMTSRLYSLCLETLRILSREKDGLDSLTTEKALKVMVKHAGLEYYAEQCQDENITIQEGDNLVIVEAQKCLCNLIFNSQSAQRICCGIGCVEGIVQRLKTYKDPDVIHDVKFFDMRMMFLLTALCAEIRPKLRGDLHGFTYLIEVLDLTLRESEEADQPLSDQDVDLCCEILKILFNLTVAVDKNNLDEEEEAHFMRLVSVLHDLLVCKIDSKEKREEIQSHTVNLLTNMPRDSYEELLTPLNEGAVGGLDNKDVEYDGKNMEAVVALLEFLERRLDKPVKSLKESLTPILHCMCETCRANRCIRKFCRSKVLPPLRDEVRRLPEEGETLRNKICRLLTDPVPEVKDLAADFLFVLCKESVGRMVKYTGYGNAAGLLAQRGLMCGGQGPGEYSSESDDSDTEEYIRLREQVNPVTGRWEEQRPDPMAGMTEEQKEYEAVQLVNKLDKLSRKGIIQPTMIGDDGKPHPVEHILQLQESIQQESSNQQERESD